MTKDLEDFFDEIDDIYHYSELSRAQKEEKVRALKLEHSRLFPIKDSNYYYFLGYAGYIARDLGEETESYFREALRLDPNNNFCQYYYAYFLFDSKRYKEALRVLEDIDLTHFAESEISWMIFKIKEAMACCPLFLATYTESDRIEKVDKFLTEYEEHVMIEEENYDDPINYPHEIIQSVRQSLDNLGENFKPVVSRLTDLMKRERLDTMYRSEYSELSAFLTRN